MVDPQQARNPAAGEDAAEKEVRIASFLAEASRLLANSLDYEDTLSTVAGLALPDLGAWCIVDVVEENDRIRRLAIVHPDPDKQELARTLRDGWPPSREDPVGVPAVARSLEPEIIPDVDDAFLSRVARDDHNLAILKELGIGSLMCVPLAARGDVLGAITFVGVDGGHSYGRADLEVAKDLANRAAIAIDNARLFRASRRAREAAEAATRAKSHFLGIMSHELRTPINAILGYTQLLAMGVKGSLTEDQRSLLSRVEASSQHLLELVTRLLDVSKAETGHLSVANEPVLVDDVITEALQVVGPRTPDRVELVSGCDGEQVLQFLGDRIRARQILVHLLTNAFRFTQGESVVRLRCSRADTAPAPLPTDGGPWIRIDVQDDGVGIPEDRLEAIFEPFVQGSTDTFTRTVDGSGLGLAIGRHLARFMGGDITVSSEQGTGSTFTLWLVAPRKPDMQPRDRRLFDRDTEGLPILADHLMKRIEPILDAYVLRLRRDPGIPRAREASTLQLRNHIPHFLVGIASLLAHSGAGEAVTDVLRGDNAIQRNVLELHGAQRFQLGWSRDALRRDLDLLRRVVRNDVRTTIPAGDTDDPLRVLDRLFEQAISISLDAWSHGQSRRDRAASAGAATGAAP